MPPKQTQDESMLQDDAGASQSIAETKQQRPEEEDDDDEETSKPGRERRKIEIKFIDDKSRRHITFSKRKAGIMKKAYELSVLTGTQVLLLVVSETGLVYTFTTPKLQPLVTKAEGKNLIQACLNAPEDPGTVVPSAPQQVSHPAGVDDLAGDENALAAAAAAAQQRAVAAAISQQQQQRAAAVLGMQRDARMQGMYNPYPVQGLQDRDKDF
ncbi:SRF-TF-domain-containing protein [Lipomyces tetrasporus]|uniref:SRF-TF-domain-containing protein n=2 Tax=Lipomyces TaxID=29828 RepID=A0AAD7QS08_9ASCO|nr:SRF-TF-domain-containing protein [Lipomyces tetrasporus]KAJ8100459.1 SRF-TF-domain-containing protein [Lipomyces tetrasporus]